jgi:hypothetical protein
MEKDGDNDSKEEELSTNGIIIERIVNIYFHT